MDVGTGGGFPGIPLAILFPECRFTLIDSIGKKIKVVNAVKDVLQLENVLAGQKRVEEVQHRFDFVVSRAVTSFPEFYEWVKNKIKKQHFNTIDNGIIYLKGGDLKEELSKFKKFVRIQFIAEYFEDEFFLEKKIVYLPFK
jgi:16S rRNA (guanine527-N7)-methyltransferase